jgi:hypothetical protein
VAHAPCFDREPTKRSQFTRHQEFIDENGGDLGSGYESGTKKRVRPERENWRKIALTANYKNELNLMPARPGARHDAPQNHEMKSETAGDVSAAGRVF